MLVSPTISKALRYAERLCVRLSRLGVKKIAVTGIHYGENMVGTFGYDTGIGFLYGREHVKKSYPGTGDLFTSVITGALTRGTPLPDAVALATSYVRDVILHTRACGTEPLYGVQLESTLDALFQGGAAPLEPPLQGH